MRYNGNVFLSSEHAYQFDRVTYLGDSKLAAQVFHAHTPQVAKRIGGQIGPSKKWDLVKVDRMKQITLTKYSQNQRLKTELLKTSPSPLIEATIDGFWGCGLTFNARNLVDGHWNGKNQMGLILVACRNELQQAQLAQQQQQSHTAYDAYTAHRSLDQQSNNFLSQPGQAFHSSFVPMQSMYLPYQPPPTAPCPPYPPPSQTMPTSLQFDQSYMGNQNQATQLQFQHSRSAGYPILTSQTSSQSPACDASPASSFESFSQGQRRLTYDPNLSPMLVA